MFQKRSLHGMQFTVVGQALDGGDAVALMHDGEGKARIYAASVDVYRAGAALSVIATFFRAE